jgi:hypothetical protein
VQNKRKTSWYITWREKKQLIIEESGKNSETVAKIHRKKSVKNGSKLHVWMT